ncbi:MAG: IS607 family transposase [Pseudomonadota bacterium]
MYSNTGYLCLYVTNKEACKLLGLHPNTLRRLADNGKIDFYRTNAGHRRYNVSAYRGLQRQSATVCYCRVSSPKQRDDLERQIQYMRERYPNAEIVKDIGSGLNYKRRGLKSLLELAMRGEQLQIVVAHKDRLTRFGFELIEWGVQKNGGRIVVLQRTNFSPDHELTNDLLSILHVFSCRMHGLRNYRSQVKQALSPKETSAD